MKGLLPNRIELTDFERFFYFEQLVRFEDIDIPTRRVNRMINLGFQKGLVTTCRIKLEMVIQYIR
jgi:hypothetical protein